MRPDSVSFPLSDLSAAILAGGRSTRFGTPKSLASVGTEQLIDYAVRLARAIAAEPMVIVSPLAGSVTVPVSVYYDLIQDLGPVGGIYTALTVSARPWVAVLPCDMPLLRPEVYAQLYANRSETRPVVAQSGQGLEPLVSLWPVSIQPRLAKAIRTDQLALFKLLRELDARVIHISERPDDGQQFFLNINTPEDFSVFLKIIRS